MGTINKLTKLVLSFLLVITCINFSVVQAEDGSDENYSEPTAVETISEEPASEPEQEVIPEEPVAEEPVIEEAAPVEEEKQEEVTPEVIEEAKVEEENNTPEIEAEPATQEETVEEVKVTVVVSYVDESDHPLTDPITGSYPIEYRLDENVDAFKSFDGYAFEKVIVNDDAKNTISKDDVQKNGFRITKDMTSLKLVYQKMNLESNENKEVIPEVTEEAVEEAEPESNTNETELFAFDQTAFAGKVGVHASAAEGVLPKGARLIVEQVNRKAILNAVENTVSDNNKEMDSAVALDISIVDKDGVEIQPNGVVNISFENAAVSGDEINVYHVTDDASAVTEVATNTQSFDANHFSIYVITVEKNVPLTTFNFVDVNGQTVSTQIVKTGDTLITPTAPDVAGKAFVGWYDGETKFEDFNTALTITETTTRTITAKYEDALYVYFYNPAGTQIMRTEKVGDHEAHDFTTVSYEVDSTHKLVGWADEASGTTNIADKIFVPEGSISVNVYAIIKGGCWVTFDSDGGSAIDSQFVFDKIFLNDQTTPTKPGYRFDGWYNGTEKVENDAIISSPMTLTAHWTPEKVSYTVIHWWENADDNGYSFHESQELQGLTGESTAAVAKSYITSGKNIHGESVKDKVFTATSISQKTIKGDGSTIVNVYYKRKTYTMHFKKRWNSRTDLSTITKKWGQSISKNEWPTYYGNGNWQISSSRYLAFTSSMPMNDSTLCSTSGDYTYNAYYYVQKVDGSGYDLHHTDTIKMDSNPKIGNEDCYAIAGFAYSHGDPGVGGRYKDAKFYYTRNSYKIRFINNGKEDKSVEKKYEQSISSENYTPTKPSSLPEYYVFDGWYENGLCEGEAFNFTGKKMPAQNVTLYAKWTASDVKLTYNLNNPEGTLVKKTEDVVAGTVASTVLPSIPTINEYSFAGWYYADGNGNITSEVFNTNNTITRDTSIVGKWLYKGQLTVVYKPGAETGATVPTDDKVYAGGARVTVAGNATTTPTSNMKFLGWELNGNVYKPGQSFEVNKGIANKDNQIILTATWGNAETSTTLTYDPGNGIGTATTRVDVMNNAAVEIEAHNSLGFTAPVAEGKEYYFAGWADSKTGNATYADGQTINIDANGENVLYAVWVEKAEITLVANSGTRTYNGAEQSIEGFESTTMNGYTVSGLTAVTKGTNVGEYTNTVFDGTAKVEKDGVDVTDKVALKTSAGKLVITPKSINTQEITVTKPADSQYDGNEHKNKPTVKDGEKVLVEDTDYTLSYSEDVINAGKVTVTITGKGNYSQVTTVDYQITPRTVKLTSGSDSKTYDGTPLVKHNATPSEDGFAKDDGVTYEFTGSQTNVGTSDNTFTYALKDGTLASNYIITTKAGKLTVNPVTDVTVTIKEHGAEHVYDGTEKTVTGYDVKSISNKLYTKDDFTFSGTAEAKGTNVGEYPMNVQASDFTNNSNNFTNVTFVIEDGLLKITSKSIVPSETNGMVVTGPQDTLYNGDEQKLTPVVKDQDKVLTENVDYKLSYTGDTTNAGTVKITIKGKGNYNGSTEVSYKITKRNVTLTSATDSKVYDKTPLTNHNVAVEGDGFVKEEGATYNVTGSQTEKGTSKNTFTYELKSNTKASNYTIKVGYGDLIVTAEDGEVVVVITGRKGTFEYTGTEKSVKGYDVSITEGSTYSESDFTFSGKDEVKGTEAGTYDMGLKPEDFTNNNENYGKVTFQVSDGQLKITPKSINPEDEKSGIEATDPADSIYNGEAHVNPLKVTDTKTGKDLVENNDYTLTYVGDVVNVGTVTVTVKGKGNYTGEFTKTYKITPREYTVTTDSAEKPYDGTALTSGGRVNNLVAGETVTLKMTGSQTKVGSSNNTYSLTWDGSAKEKNYTHGTDSIGTLTVNKQSIDPGTDPEKPNPDYTGAKVNSPKDSVYDGKEHKWSPTVTDKADKKLEAGTDYTVSYDTADFTNVHTITVTIEGIGNYTGTVVRTYAITPAEVTVTANNANKVYGENDPELKATVTGTLNNDTVDYTVTRDSGEDVGTYAIHVTGEENQGNYKVTYTPGTFEITKSGELILTAELTGESATKVYDGNPLTGGATANVKEGTTITYSTDSGATWTTEVPSITNVGTLNITARAENPNYEPAETTYSLTVTHATAIVTAENKTKVYGTADPELTATVSGTLGNDTVAYTLAREAGENAGKYKITVTGEENQGNYKVTYTPGTFEITPKSIIPDGPETPDDEKTGITVENPGDVKYDGKDHAEKPVVKDEKTGKTLTEGTDYTLTYSEDVTNAGKVTVTVTGIGNYTGEFDVTYEITKRDVVLTSATDSKPYDGTALRNENVEVTGDGFAAGEGATFAVTGTITNVGTKANTFGYALNKNTLASNYNISTELGTLTITPKSIIPDGPETPDDEKTGITVENPGDVKYDGKDHAEKPVVKDEKTGVTLEEGKDYEIVYPDDIKNAGEITATVVGKGDYEGSFEIKYNITKRDVTFTSATDSKQYDGNALTNGNVEITGDGFIEGEGAEYKVTGTQTQVGNSANEFEYTLNENTLASNYDITKVVGTLTVTAAPAPETPEKPKPEVKKSVDTSDDNNTVFYGNAFFMAMITLAGIIVLRKKSS